MQTWKSECSFFSIQDVRVFYRFRRGILESAAGIEKGDEKEQLSDDIKDFCCMSPFGRKKNLALEISETVST